MIIEAFAATPTIKHSLSALPNSIVYFVVAFGVSAALALYAARTWLCALGLAENASS